MESKTPLENVRLLVVEDDQDSREMLVEYASLLGATARGAADADEALQQASEFAPGVALIDIGLPGRNGCDVARLLRKTDVGLRMRLIALTGSSDDGTRQTAAAAGFDDFVVKPLLPQTLTQLLSPTKTS